MAAAINDDQPDDNVISDLEKEWSRTKYLFY